MTHPGPYHLFERFGVEIEYMLVRRDGLSPYPIADVVLERAAGQPAAEATVGSIGYSNELVLHVLELKTAEPAKSLKPLARDFQEGVARANAWLGPEGGCLLPTGMHPLMQPARETRIWPHEGREIYEAFDRLFDAHRHGWANLQSVHLNLPYHGDAEFFRLHTAIRVALPLLPLLAASSPIAEGRLTGHADHRLFVYQGNSARLPCITGSVIPELVHSQAEYHDVVLAPIAKALEAEEHAGLLEAEWVNARGAIARPSRGSIELRLLDVQEHPGVDLAIVEAVVAVVKMLVEEATATAEAQSAHSERELLSVLQAGIHGGAAAVIEDTRYLTTLGFPPVPTTGRELWRALVERFARAGSISSESRARLDPILLQGTLSERIMLALPKSPTQEEICVVYQRLAECLREGEAFLGSSA